MDPERPAHAAHAPWKDGKIDDRGSAYSIPFTPFHGIIRRITICAT